MWKRSGLYEGTRLRALRLVSIFFWLQQPGFIRITLRGVVAERSKHPIIISRLVRIMTNPTVEIDHYRDNTRGCEGCSDRPCMAASFAFKKRFTVLNLAGERSSVGAWGGLFLIRDWLHRRRKRRTNALLQHSSFILIILTGRVAEWSKALYNDIGCYLCTVQPIHRDRLGRRKSNTRYHLKVLETASAHVAFCVSRTVEEGLGSNRTKKSSSRTAYYPCSRRTAYRVV